MDAFHRVAAGPRRRRTDRLDAPPAAMGVSVVVPLKDEREAVPEMSARLVACLRDQQLNDGFEVIFVDDGSEDGCWDAVLEAGATHPEVLGLRHRCNFGKAAALATGMAFAQGGVIVTIDGDLQDDPDEIPRFLEAIAVGADVVSGWKQDRQDPLGKRLPSLFFNTVTRRLSHVELRDFNCGFKAYTASAAQAMRPYLYGELHRYLPVLLAAHGFATVELSVRHHPRRFGSSKYGLERVVKGGFDLCTVLLLTRFRFRPLHAFGATAMMSAAASGGAALVAALVHPAAVAPLILVGTLAVFVLVVAGCVAELVVHGMGPLPVERQVAELAAHELAPVGAPTGAVEITGVSPQRIAPGAAR